MKGVHGAVADRYERKRLEVLRLAEEHPDMVVSTIGATVGLSAAAVRSIIGRDEANRRRSASLRASREGARARKASRARVKANAMRVRDQEIRAQSEAGMTLQAIGDLHGLTRERVRQIVAADVPPPRPALVTEQQRRDKIHQLADQNLDMSASRIAQQLGIAVSVVREVLGQQESDQRRWRALTARRSPECERDEILGHLRTVAELAGVPMGPNAYDSYRTNVDGSVSSHRVEQVFGSWDAACDLAGLPRRRSLRGRPPEWCRDELLAWVRRYVAQCQGPPTIAGYTQWSRQHPGAPSASTLRTRVDTSWPRIIDEAS